MATETTTTTTTNEKNAVRHSVDVHEFLSNAILTLGVSRPSQSDAYSTAKAKATLKKTNMCLCFAMSLDDQASPNSIIF